jgi:hypothetical protein
MGYDTTWSEVPYSVLQTEAVFPTVADILSIYEFSRYDYRTFLSADGRLLQASMLVQNRNDPNDRYIVMADYERNEWTVQCPRHKNYMAPIMIEAVRARVAVNRSLRRKAA